MNRSRRWSVWKAALLTVGGGLITPTVSVYPVDFYYGTALNNSQLGGSATSPVNGQSVPGTFTFDTGVGTVPTAGMYTFGVTFTPNDTADYNSVDTTTQVDVLQARLSQLQIEPTVGTSYGTSVNSISLSFLPLPTSTVTGASVSGTWAFTGPYPGGSPYLPVAQYPYGLEAVFTPTDSIDYTTTSIQVQVEISQVQLTSTVAPVTITYGTPTPTSFQGTGILSYAGQPVTESTVFIPYLSTLANILPVGQYQEGATPAVKAGSNADYSFSNAVVRITVTPATPTVTVNPVSIPLGTALNNTQLTGSATWTVNGQLVSVPGTFTYAAAGTILGPGNSQEEVVTFTPTDSTDYTPVTLDVLVNVSGALPVVPQAPVNMPGNRG